MKRARVLALSGLALLASGCAATGARTGPVDVTRFHLDQPLPAGSVIVEPADSNTTSPEYQVYLDAVRVQLDALGYYRAPDNATSTYIAGLAFRRTYQGSVRDRPPVSVGVGGGSFGGNVGVGGGLSFGIGGKRRDAVLSELSVQLRRRSDSTVVWEGRAVSESLQAPGEVSAQQEAERLARALFRGFPGESGITTRVK